MQEQRQESHQEPQEHHVLPASAPPTFGLNPPDSVSLTDTRLNAYLDTICALMPAHVPAEFIADMRREMHIHLQTALAAMEELGYAHEEAAAHAITQFGEPRMVAKHWRQEWEKTLAHTDTEAFWPSLQTSVKIWTAAHTLVTIYLCSTVGLYSTRLIPFWTEFLTASMLGGLPFLTGAAIGLKARRRPVICAFTGYALTLPVIALGVLLYLIPLRAFQLSHNLSGLGSVPWPLLSKVGFSVYFYSFFVLPIGVAGASVMALGRRIRTCARRRIAS